MQDQHAEQPEATGAHIFCHGTLSTRRLARWPPSLRSFLEPEAAQCRQKPQRSATPPLSLKCMYRPTTVISTDMRCCKTVLGTPRTCFQRSKPKTSALISKRRPWAQRGEYRKSADLSPEVQSCIVGAMLQQPSGVPSWVLSVLSMLSTGKCLSSFGIIMQYRAGASSEDTPRSSDIRTANELPNLKALTILPWSVHVLRPNHCFKPGCH